MTKAAGDIRQGGQDIRAGSHVDVDITVHDDRLTTTVNDGG
jgi:hypothetical protein